jgi:hypothetical protein
MRPALAAAAVVTITAAIAVGQVLTIAAATAAVPGLQVVSAVTIGDSVSPKSVTATCPTGKRVIGTGFYVDGASDEVVVTEVIPYKGSVLVTAYEDQSATTAIWWLRAFAVCANPMPGLTIATVTSPSTSSDKSVAVTCPAGTRAVGTGAAIAGGLGQVLLDAMLPVADGTYVEAFEDADGTKASWTVTAYALCAVAPAGWQLVTSHTPADSLNKVDTPTCAPGAAPLGLGWDLKSNAAGRLLVDVAMPKPAGALISARENYPAVTSTWLMTTRVICATP